MTKLTIKAPVAPLSAGCQHELVPFEFIFGRQISTAVSSNRAFTPNAIDWSSNASNAHRARVTKFYCSRCKKIIHISLNDSEISI